MYKSSRFKSDRAMAGARALWRAVGMKENDFGKPIIAIVNSFTQFVPGHVHLHNIGQMVKKIIDGYGGFGAEFNTIAIDDGIAMGHNGMLYSLPSRDLIADSVEYMVNAHCADAMICISNCDKITPGMMMASMRLNIPTLFVSGGPMEAGVHGERKLDLIDSIIAGGDDTVNDEELLSMERSACPTCGSCSGMFTANSMNCLAEALGLALPGNGSVVATHVFRKELFEQAARRIVEMALNHYEKGDSSLLPRAIATKSAFENAMTLDIAMGGSTNTVLHTLAIAREANVDFTMSDIDAISRRVPTLAKVAPSSSYHLEDVHRAGGIVGILEELAQGDLLNINEKTVLGITLKEQLKKYGVRYTSQPEFEKFYRAAPGHVRTTEPFLTSTLYDSLDLDKEHGCIRDIKHAYSKEGGLCVLYGNIAKDGSIVKSAGVDESLWKFAGPARIFHSQEDACKAILTNQIKKGDVVIIRYEGPKGGPGMQEMLYPTSYLKSKHLGKECALITDGRFSGGTSGLSIGHVSPEAAERGEIALVEDGDIIEIDIPNRKLNVKLTDAELARRAKLMDERSDGWSAGKRDRIVSPALEAYSLMTTSAAHGAVRDLSRLKNKSLG